MESGRFYALQATVVEGKISSIVEDIGKGGKGLIAYK